MLTIRQQQVDVLSQYMVRQFENRVLAYLRRQREAQVQGQSEEQVRETIRAGIERARRYGIVLEQDVQRYIDLMVRLGPEFDTAPSTCWAGAELGKRAVPPRQRLEAVEQHLGSQP